MKARHAALILAATLSLTACGGGQDARIAYYDDHDGRVDRSKWEKNNQSTIRTFLKPAKSGGFKSSIKSSSTRRAGGRR